MKPPTPEFIAACDAFALDVDQLPIAGFSQYLTHLLKVNETCNLTAVRNEDEAWMRHIFDSLTLVPLLTPDNNHTWVDVGTGGGLPGIVLALVFPQQPIHLIEATGKKCRFLTEVAAALALKNITVHHARAEEAGQDIRLRESFDRCFSRAVSATPVLLEYCLPLLKVGGKMIALKGERYQEELAEAKKAMQVLGTSVPEVHRVPGNPGATLVWTKTKPTPNRYPRNAGLPRKDPII